MWVLPSRLVGGALCCFLPRFFILHHLLDPTVVVLGTESAERPATMITVIVTVFEAAGPTVLKTKTVTILLQTPNLASQAPPFVMETSC